jgi:hypothetical protein
MQTSAPAILTHVGYSRCLIFRSGYTQPTATHGMTSVTSTHRTLAESNAANPGCNSPFQPDGAKSAMTSSISTSASAASCHAAERTPKSLRFQCEFLRSSTHWLHTLINSRPTLPTDTLYFDRISSIVPLTFAGRRVIRQLPMFVSTYETTPVVTVSHRFQA